MNAMRRGFARTVLLSRFACCCQSACTSSSPYPAWVLSVLKNENAPFRAISSAAGNVNVSSTHLPGAHLDINAFPPEKIRNFCIIAHVDHGKSTLADRLMELTGVVKPGGQAQQLDKLQRGITVKAQTCCMVYNGYLLNLIDTPGHADFTFEVTRSLAACDGAVLLVAANQGVRAQTVANFWLAFEKDVVVIPVINKIDLDRVDVSKVLSQLKSLFEFDEHDCFKVSAKTGLNVSQVLDAIIERVPPPRRCDRSALFRALVYDTTFVEWRGAIACVLVTDGFVEKGSVIRTYHGDAQYEVVEVGVMQPDMKPCRRLSAGQVGYVVANMKTVREAAVGETLYSPKCVDSSVDAKEGVTPFDGFAPNRPNVYSGLFPVDPADYESLKQALDRLSLNDPAVTYEPTVSPALGYGWLMGFLGVLHMEVFSERLEQEYDASVIVTAPNVEYRAVIVDNESIRQRRFDGKSEITMIHPSSLPKLPGTDVAKFLEPMVKATLLIPSEYLGPVSTLCNNKRGMQQSATMLDDDSLVLVYRLPLAEVVVDFLSTLKGVTSGYASFDYEPDGYNETDLVKLSITVNNQLIDEFSLLTPASMAKERARTIVGRLKKEIPQQQFGIDIVASTGAKSVVASAKIHPLRKDFTGKLKGNMARDRVQKKLSHQEKGKKQLKLVGNVPIPKQTFASVLRI